MDAEEYKGTEERMENGYGVQKFDRRQIFPSTYMRDPDQETENQVHLRDYLKILMKRKQIILIFFISVLITGTLFTLMTTPLYKSTAVIRIDKDGPDSLSLGGFKPERDAGYYTTQYEILKSQTLSERVIKKLALDKNRDFMPPPGGAAVMMNSVMCPVNNTISWLSSIFEADDVDEKAQKTAEPAARDNGIPQYMVQSLIGRLEVLPVKNSQLVSVSFISHKPELSLAVANAVAECYIEYDLDSRIAATKQSRDFLVKQIEMAKNKLDDSERRLSEYASKQQIIFFDSDKQGVNIKKFSDLTAALSAATTERLQKESLLKELKESGAENPVILNNPLIQELKRQQASLETEYASMSKVFTPDYPKMVNLQKQLDSLSKRMDREKSNIVKSLESDYKASQKKEETFRTAFYAQQKNVLDFQEKVATYQNLKREADVNMELHNSLLQKLNEASVASLSKSTSIQVVDAPRYPTSPCMPNKARNILLSVLFGLAGGIGLAFSIEYFDNTIKDVGDVEKRVYAPTLGLIPLQEKQKDSSLLMIGDNREATAFSEAFRSIGVILLSSTAKPPRTILVTSPMEKEGKTTVSVSTAVALSESVGNGIIIDADLRRPRLHDIFHMDNSRGLSTYLSGKAGIDAPEAGIIRPTDIKGLSVITSGPIPQNPSELMLSTRIKDLIASLSASFNFVIIDSVPLMGMPESIYLSKVVDGTVLVVRGGNTSKDAMIESAKIFNYVDAKLLGVVINGARKGDLKYGPDSYYASYFNGG